MERWCIDLNNKSKLIWIGASLFILCLLVVGINFVSKRSVGVRNFENVNTGDFKEKTYSSLKTVDFDDTTEVKSEKVNSTENMEGAVVATSKEEINGHKLITENDAYEMYFLEESLSVILRDKKTGAIMESIVKEDDSKSNATWLAFMKSGVLIQVLKGINIVPTTADVRKAEKTITYTENGFQADLYYKEFGIGLSLLVSLTEDGFTASIPDNSIKEDSDEYKVGEIYVYPFLGNTHLGDRSGYMFIPDGNGALIYLEDNEGRFTSNYSQYIYGMNTGVDEAYTLSLLWDYYQSVNEADKIMAPVFGMVHTDTDMGFLGIVESGDYSAKLEAYPNGAYTAYNWICPKFIYRQIYTQPTGNKEGSVVTRQAERNKFDIKINYRFLSGEDANYTGLATKYREYLLENKKVVTKEDDFKIRLDFLGTDKENWLIFKRNVVMTTIEDIRNIYEDLKKEGVTDILSVYKGWQKNGINSLPITKYKADSDLGGTKELTKLIEETKAAGIDFYLAQDVLRVNPTLNNANFNIMKQITKRVYEESTYKDVFEKMRYLTPMRSSANLESSAKSFQKQGVNQISLSGISNILFTFSSKGKVYSRGNTADMYEEVIAELNQKFDYIMEKPFTYLWKYTDAITDMPITSSNYIFTDEEVPFLSIVLKGILPMYAEYTNFEANKKESFLRLVEMGVNPSFYLTYEDPAQLLYTNSSDVYSSKYGIYKESIINYYKALKEVHDKTKGSVITNHKQYENGLTVVTYDNGVTVLINYNGTTTIRANGFELEPMSYKVGGAE